METRLRSLPVAAPALPAEPALARGLRRFYQLLAVLAGLSMVSAFGAVALGVAVRLLGVDLAGLDAYAGYAIAAAMFLALPDTFRRGEHIQVTLLLQRLGGPVRRLAELGGLAVGLGLSLYLAWFALRLVWVSRLTHDVSQGLDATPLWIPQLSMALGCVGFAVAFADALWARLQRRAFFAAEGGAAHIE